ncbi:hypothetical protein [Oceanobacillus halophilus]|uniref:Transporter n=1 Tax=Oceanobacillus halophilus TaxID=930130 RepID=A0A495A1A9_9BACI|nr:hypothetical protein [Oceanobacillus halophilus]RKQ33248.1 hypothetical protein D8M06_10770 [Oceanobacillus halophilus]
MNDYYPHHYQPYHQEEERQFNLPWYLLNQFFGPGGGPGSGFPGGGPGQGFPGGGPGGGFPGGGPGQGFPGGGPGGGFPGGGPGQGFPGGGSSGGQQSGPPTSPPPNFTPQQSQFQTFAVDPGGIRGCLFRFTYVWLRRDSFWYYPTFVGRNSIAGYRWNGWRWVYFGIDLDRIESFQCY